MVSNKYERLITELTTEPSHTPVAPSQDVARVSTINPQSPSSEIPYGKQGIEPFLTLGQKGAKWLTKQVGLPTLPGRLGDLRFQNNKHYYLNIQGIFRNEDPEEALRNFLAYVEKLKQTAKPIKIGPTQEEIAKETPAKETPAKETPVKEADETLNQQTKSTDFESVEEAGRRYIKENNIKSNVDVPYISKSEILLKDYFINAKKEIETDAGRLGVDVSTPGWFSKHVEKSWPNWELRNIGGSPDPEEEQVYSGSNVHWSLKDVQRFILPIVEDGNNVNNLQKMTVVAVAGDRVPAELDMTKSVLVSKKVLDEVSKNKKIPEGYVVIQRPRANTQLDLPLRGEWNSDVPDQRFNPNKESYTYEEISNFLIEAKKPPRNQPYLIPIISQASKDKWVYTFGPKAGQVVQFKQKEPAKKSVMINAADESPNCQPFKEDGTINNLTCWLNVVANRVTIAARNDQGVSPYQVVETYIDGRGIKKKLETISEPTEVTTDEGFKYEALVGEILQEAENNPLYRDPIKKRNPNDVPLQGKRAYIDTNFIRIRTREGEEHGLMRVTPQQVMNFHQAMVTYFIKTGLLLYLTPEQWGELAPAGSIFKKAINVLSGIGASTSGSTA